MAYLRKWVNFPTWIAVIASTLISILINIIHLPPLANTVAIPILVCLTLVLINATVHQSKTPKNPPGRRRVMRELLPMIATVPFTILFVLTTLQKNQLDQESERLKEERQSFDETKKLQLKQLRMGYLPKGGGKSIPPPNYRPLQDDLQSMLGIDVTSFDKAQSYTEVVNLLAQGKIEMAWLGPLSYLYAAAKCQPRMLLSALDEDGPPYYYSCIIMKKASGIKSLQELKSLPDLKQKDFSIVDKLSTSGYLVPRAILLEKVGIDLWQDLTVREEGSHQQVLQKVLNGTADIGAISSVVYEKALIKKLIKQDDLVILNQDYKQDYKSESYRIPYGPIVLRKDIQDYDAFRLEDAFLTIAQDDPGALPAQDVAGLAKAIDKNYDVIRHLVEQFHINVSELPKDEGS